MAFVYFNLDCKINFKRENNKVVCNNILWDDLRYKTKKISILNKSKIVFP